MSTYFFYRCLQHEPPLLCEDEVTQHQDENLKQAIRLAEGAPAIEVNDYLGSYYGQRALAFLKQHQGCPMDIVSENGDVIPIPGREKR